MIQRNRTPLLSAFSFARVTSASAVGLCAALLGCSDDSINMGEGIPVVPEETLVESAGGCAENPILAGDVTVANQAELDALEGCEVIDGNLSVYAFEGGNLRALHALRAVTGIFILGGTLPNAPADFGPDGEGLGAEQVASLADYQLLQEEWLSSLEGLESLESAGSLTLNGLTTDNLRPLANLQSLNDGGLTIWSSDKLRNFDGLQKLRDLRYLSISGAKRLQSFDGLTLPTYMANLDIDGADLRSLRPLGVESVGALTVAHTSLANLDAFANLGYADRILIQANMKLEVLSGLENLWFVQNLDLDYNRSLLDIPDFEQLYGLRSLRITGSPKLARMPAFPMLDTPPFYQLNPQEFVLQRPEVLELEDLGLVTSIRLPASWSSTGIVMIRNNASLTHVSFTGQTYIDYLSIMNNPLLNDVSIGELDKVNVLEVVDNPQLTLSTFDSVRRLDLTASGNAP